NQGKGNWIAELRRSDFAGILAMGILSAAGGHAQSMPRSEWHPSNSIGPAQTEREGTVQVRPYGLDLKCLTLQNLVRAAYSTFASGSSPNPGRIQVLGGPSWITSEYYDVIGKTNGIAPLTEMAGADLRSSTKRDSVGDSTSLSNARLSPAQRLTPGDADGIS